MTGMSASGRPRDRVIGGVQSLQRSTAVELAAYGRADHLPWSRDRAAIHCTLTNPGASFVVFDTLRFADRLRSSGFESRQAEGLARALGDELGEVTGDLVTKSHLDSEVGAVRSDIRALDAKVDALGARLDARIDALDARIDALDAKLDALDAKLDAVDGKLDAVDGKLDARIDALGTQVRFIFAALALLLALGLVDTVPRLLG